MTTNKKPLTTEQLTTLQTLTNIIVPPDDFPGAWDAGVGNYILGQFERDLAPLLPLYHIGLDAIEAECAARYDRPFAELDEALQTDLVSSLEKGQVVTRWQIAPERFLRMAVDHTMEGYYGDPGNGGNHDAVSWQMIGFKVTA